MNAGTEDLKATARRLIAAFTARGQMLVTAESCTGGLLAAYLTDVPGSSAVVERGFVTYSNRAKAEMLGVDPAMIEAHGAVSETVARQMAEGALRHSAADIAVAVTGIAGPGGGTATKPVGLVHFACAGPSGIVQREMRFGDIGREHVRLASVKIALNLLAEALEFQAAGDAGTEFPRP